MSINVTEFKSMVWYEKYRPTDLDSILLPARLKTSIRKYINSGEIPCMLFHSTSPGVGKTSLAYIICKELDADYLYINTSLDNGIDILRSRIEKFATTVSFTGKKKIVIMDEFDGSSKQLQDAMRASIENFTESCRFIFTCNNINRIEKPLRSRCQVINFDFNDEAIKNEMLKKMHNKLIVVLKNEAIDVDLNALANVVNKNYPDMRRMYNLLQDFADSNNNIITKEILKFRRIDDVLIDFIIQNDFKKAREHVIKSSYNYSELYRYLFDKLIPRLEGERVALAIMVISEFMWRESSGVLDSEINFAHCLLNIMQVI